MDTFRSFPLYKELDVERVSAGFVISDFSIMFDSVTIQNLPEPLNTDVQQMCWKNLMLLRGKRPKIFHTLILD